jgi:hypothetical protein
MRHMPWISWGRYSQLIPLRIVYGYGAGHRVTQVYGIGWRTGFVGIFMTRPLATPQEGDKWRAGGYWPHSLARSGLDYEMA